ncbi:response regulator [bacterium]|nr:response regulator [bacterium]
MNIVEILLVEDNPGDVELTTMALQDAKIINHVTVVEDGLEAMALLHRRGKYATASRPDAILLDLNLPKMDGRAVLAEIKRDEDLRTIPVVVLTTSDDDADILKAYDLHANCYVTKPVDVKQFLKVVKSIEDFWFTIVKLPGKKKMKRK